MAVKYSKIGRVSSESVRKGTGRGWDEWIPLLSKAGASGWTHKEIVAFLKKKYKLSPWWQQGVTLGFEVAIQRRVDGQNQKGEYTVTATRSIAMDAKALWKLLTSPAGLEAWLTPLSAFKMKPKATYECEGGVFGEVRTMVAGRRVRMTWQETEWLKPTVFQIGLVARPKKKTILYISQDGLKTVQQREAMRAKWKNGLSALAQLASAEA